MTLIQLHYPVPATPADNTLQRFERVHMFPGRHLGEEEFDREQAYADLRLLSLLRGHPAGIVQGLEIQLGRGGLRTPFPLPPGTNPALLKSTDFSVSQGLALDGKGRAVSLYYPLRAEWQDLLDAWRLQHPGQDATGVYYLLLRRSQREVDSPTVDPCQRLERDPTRDTRLVVASTLVLQRLNIDPATVTNPAITRERIENWVAADRVDGSFMASLGSAVPLALLAIGPTPAGHPFSHEPHWLSVEAGRYEAVKDSGYRVLLNQVSAALRRLMQQAQSPSNTFTTLGAFLNARLQLDFLPAAGQLPLQWLEQPDSVTPNLLWLPNHLGVDMVPVPEEAVLELIQRDLARRVIDLRQPAGDKIRLLLAVNEPDYRPDLLDIPPTDAQLEQDIFRFYMRAYEAWRQWHIQFNRLYYVEPSDELPLEPDQPNAALEPGVLNPMQFRHLDLPKPEHPPVKPVDFFNAVRLRADNEFDPGDDDMPYPFNKPLPPPPVFYTQWLNAAGHPPAVPLPTEDGLLIQYAVALVELEAIENQIRASRKRVENTRDLLLLMRQQLDSQTVALAALAGGVAGDGGGLQVARWLPYASLNATTLPKDQQETTTTVTTAPVYTAATRVNLASAAKAAPTASSGLSASLMKNALASTSTVSKSNLLLASRPQSFSAFELGINKARLDQLAQVTKQAVAKPAFEAKEYRFGVIDHISPEINEYAKAYYGMKELIATLKDLFDASDASSLRKDLQKVGRADEGNEGPGTTSPFERSARLEAPAVLDNLATQNSKKYDDGTDVPAGDQAKRRALLLSQYRYHALFKAGRILTQWIAICESRYNTIERKLQAKLRQQAVKIAQIDKLAGLIKVARETLENLDRFRIEQLGDYGVAQRLLDEDWRQVYAINVERSRILTQGLRGLYYVRVRRTPVSGALADPLALRHGSSRDIVPGCDWEEEVDLPDALEPFFNTVCEIPMDDWARLKPLRPRLPPLQQFDYLGQIRQSRFKARPVMMASQNASDTLAARLQTVHLQNRTVLQQWSAFTLPSVSTSTLQTQAAAAKVLSLEDLALTNGPLRKEAHELKEQLEHAVYCLLERLNLLPGSVRLQWGQLAEDDQIRVENTAWWPGLEKAERDDFNATRTVAELISWWFRQLDGEASGNSRSALRNMIRALLIHASLGDPQEIIRGNVHVPPRLARVGERLQVKLNRAAPPGTRLQLLDTEQKVVAVLAVEDHTPDSTQVSIVNLVLPDVAINTRFSVVAGKTTRQKL